MKNLVILLVAAVIVAGGYGYNKNPKACQKLGSDIVNDIAMIFTKSDSTKPDDMSAAATTPAAPVGVPLFCSRRGAINAGPATCNRPDGGQPSAKR